MVMRCSGGSSGGSGGGGGNGSMTCEQAFSYSQQVQVPTFEGTRFV